jgi:hypothetical protein
MRSGEEPSATGGRQAIHLPPLVLRSDEEPSATGGRYFKNQEES